MKIKTKLAISFCIIIFVPVVLTGMVLVGFNKIQLKAINKTYGMEDAGMLALTDTVQFLNKVTGRTYDELEKTSLIEPAKLLDSDYLTKINKKLEKKYSYPTEKLSSSSYAAYFRLLFYIPLQHIGCHDPNG